jgi:hypothetical protein
MLREKLLQGNIMELDITLRTSALAEERVQIVKKKVMISMVK